MICTQTSCVMICHYSVMDKKSRIKIIRLFWSEWQGNYATLRDTYGMRTWFCCAKQNRIDTSNKKENTTARVVFSFLVGMTGFEPATSCSQSTRATNCATSRNIKLWWFDPYRIRLSPAGSVTLGENNTQLFSDASRRFATFDIVLATALHPEGILKKEGTEASVPWCSCGESNSGHLD